MPFTVVLGRRAQADIAGQVAWRDATPGQTAANRWRVGLLSAVIPALELDPHRYPEAEEAADLGMDLREVPHGRGGQVYRVLFTVDAATQTVTVHRVRHAAQDRLQSGDV